MPLSPANWGAKMAQWWLLYSRSETNPAIGAWPHYRNFNNTGFAIICQCETIEPGNSSLLNHVFYCINSRTESYRYVRSIQAKDGSYVLCPGKDELTVDAKPQSLSGLWGFREGICGIVAPAPEATCRIITKLNPDKPNSTAPDPIVCIA